MINRIAVVCYEQMLGSSMHGTLEMMAAARVFSGTSTRCSIDLVSTDLSSITMADGTILQPTAVLDTLKQADLIVLPAIWGHPKRVIQKCRSLVPWLKRQGDAGVLVCATGTGCCFLAEAGLLDGQPATTHWHYFDRFARDYPAVQLRRSHLITQAGNIYCAASVNSLADLMVHVIERTHDKAIARKVERHFSPEIRRDFDSTVFSAHRYSSTDDEMVVQVQQFFHDNYAGLFSLQQIAEGLGVSLRTLNRRFKQGTGMTPLAYVQKLRLAQAEDLLKNTNIAVSEVAHLVGYSNLAYFSRLFKQSLQQSPSEYRKAIRAKLFRVI